jgi:hypothetical protein
MMTESQNNRKVDATIAGQRSGKTVSTVTNQRATIHEMFEKIFSIRSLLSLYNEVTSRWPGLTEAMKTCDGVDV